MRHLKKYITNPKQAFANKTNKIRERTELKINYIKNRLTGNYTSKRINLSWEGKPYRYDLINLVIREMGYKKYLEIGCFKDDCFKRIEAQSKTGVDPVSGGTLRMTSDAFFASNRDKFDFIFIDGLHTKEQVRLDIINALDALEDNGTIMMHDCIPLTHGAQTVPPEILIWNGDVWKTIVEFSTWKNIDLAVCAIDHGVGVIRKRPTTRISPLPENTDFPNLKYADFADKYDKWLRVLEFGDVMKFVKQESA